jgi:WD40 repeat protein
MVHYFKGHSQEVCGLKWSTGNQLATGGNDNKVSFNPFFNLSFNVLKNVFKCYNIDVSFVKLLIIINNQVFIWNNKMPSGHEHKITKHNAAVKALAWSSFNPSLLLTGGGNNDRMIHAWNTLTMKCSHSFYTGN